MLLLAIDIRMYLFVFDADVGASAVELKQVFGSERIHRQLLRRGILSG